MTPDVKPRATETLTLYNGTTLTNVHAKGDCLLEHCCIHNPSDHPLNTAPYAWIPEVNAMYRVCEHGYHHPDPDDQEFMFARWRLFDIEAIASVHLVKGHCDGCCQT